jgi:hypothetical protein
VWVKSVLALAAAVLSAWSLIAKKERNSIESADLHFRWNMLAMDYQSMWAEMYDVQARDRLQDAQERGAMLSKSSTAFPNDEALMEKCQDHVDMHHRSELGARQGLLDQPNRREQVWRLSEDTETASATLAGLNGFTEEVRQSARRPIKIPGSVLLATRRAKHGPGPFPGVMAWEGPFLFGP